MRNKYNFIKIGFTLAETLITLTVVGVLATIMIPSVTHNTNSQIETTKMKNFERQFNSAIEVMKLKNDLAKKYPTTMDFVNSMKKYLATKKICDNAHLKDCFPEKIYTKDKQLKYNLNDLKTTANIKADYDIDFDADFIGVKFRDNTSAIIAYNPDCTINNAASVNADARNCLVMFYDVNTKNKANSLGTDLAMIDQGKKLDKDYNQVVDEPTTEPEEEKPPYTVVKYIESAGKQYINTGFYPTGNSTVVVDVQMINQASSQVGILGARSGSGTSATKSLVFFTGRNVAEIQVDYNKYPWFYTKVNGLNLNNRNVFSLSNTLLVNNTEVKSTSKIDFTATVPMYIFANNQNNSMHLPSKMKLYSLQIYDNDILMMDFIPVLDQDEIPCLYDKVSKTFFYNQGQGSFLYEE